MDHQPQRYELWLHFPTTHFFANCLDALPDLCICFGIAHHFNTDDAIGL
jgi:hypothetical protein